MSNEAAGISSDSVKIRLVRGGTEIASYQADKVVKEDFGLVVKVTRGEEEVATTTKNHNIVSDVEENSGLVVKVTRETEPVAEETPVVEEKVEEAVTEKETVEDSKDQDNVFAVRGKIVNDIDSGIKFVATDINKPFNKILENMDDNHVDIVDKDFMDAISEFGNKNAEVEALVAKKVANDMDNVILDDLKKNSITTKEEAPVETSAEELDKEMSEAEADAQAEPIEDIDTAFNHIFESLKKNSITVEEAEKVEPVVEAVEAVIEEKLENSNSKRPAKKAKKSSSKKVEEKAKASKKKPVAKKTTKVSKPVEIAEDPEDPKPALDTSTDTELLTDVAATLDPYEAPIETEAEVAHDMIAEMVASKEPIALELIRDSDTKVTVDDILKNY